MNSCKTTVKYPIILNCDGGIIEVGDLNIPINSIKTFSSTGLLTSFSFNHLSASTPNYVGIEALTEDAREYSHITYDATSVTIHYPVAPPVGVDNLIFNTTVA